MGPKTFVYVDGFNLYYGSLRNTAYRWLDLAALCEQVLPHNQIEQIRYFTARVRPLPGDARAPRKQNAYLRAIATIPNLTIHEGHFRVNRYRGRLTKPIPGGPLTAEVFKPEEKGSDVNLATNLLLDAFRKQFDLAAVITNDSDLAEPIRVVNQELGIPVGVVNPQRGTRPSVHLRNVAAFNREIRTSKLHDCVFPDKLQDEKGVIRKPDGW